MSRELRCERLVQASPVRVFDLFTSAAGQREFYGDGAPGWVVDSRCELRAGGAWEISFGPSPGELYRHRHLFEAIERPRRLLLATTGTRLDGSRLAFSTEFTFAPRDGATWPVTRVARGGLTTEITALKAGPGPDVIVWGGGRFAGALAAADLTDEYRLLVQPLVLGQGRALFDQLPGPRHLNLVEALPFPSGIVVHICRPRHT